MTTFHGRLLISSLPDLRGIWGLSYDKGSVISIVASASQLILAPILPFFLTALGLRRLLLPLSLGFVCVAFCIPFISGYENLLVAHALMGLLIGSFVTATIQIMLKHLPPPWWVVVLALFTFRVSLGINSGVSLGAFYLEYMGWQWIYWQSGLIMFVYFVLLQRHLPPDTPIRELLHKPDYSGMGFYCLSAVLIYAGLDQGERLGWFDSGIITVFLAGGIVSFLLFLANEALVERPWAPPRLFADFNIIMSVGMVIIYIFILSANSLLITLFLDTVHDLRPLQNGLPLLLVALLQLLATPFCAFLVLKADTRLLCATGVLLMGLACYQGTFITADWVAADFFPMAILFAIGHPLVFLSLMAFCMACFTAKTAVGLLAYIQVSRISTPIAGNALFLLLIRQRVDLYFSQTGSRLTGDAPAVARFLDSGGSLDQLGQQLQTDAFILGINDVFALCVCIALGTMLLLAFVKAMKPTPVSPVDLGTPGN